jgi:hypothetical protein
VTAQKKYHSQLFLPLSSDEEIIMSKQKGDMKRFGVGVFVQVKGGGKPFGILLWFSELILSM